MTESTSTQNSNSSSAPWAPQAAALQGVFTNAQGAYNTASQAKAPSNFTAGMTPDQLANFSSMIGYGGSQQPNASAVTSAGVNNLGTGSNAAAGALSTLGAFNPSASNNMDTVSSGANQFANGIDVNGQVRAAMQPAMEQMRDVTLPGMESGAAGSGNINSSRTGIAEGIAERGLAENAQNTAATIRNNAINTGAGIAANQAGLNNAQTLQAATSGGYLGTNLGATGASEVGSGIGDAGNLFTLAAQGGAGQQQNNQLGLTNNLQQYEAQVSSPYDALNGLMNIIGNRNWGSNTTGTATTASNPSMLQTIGGIASIF